MKKKEKEKLKCKECDFTTTSEQGLKTHSKRKHEEIKKYPRSCELCEFKLKNKQELKVHMKQHSYKRIDYINVKRVIFVLVTV